MGNDIDRAVILIEEYIATFPNFDNMKPKVIIKSEAVKVFQDKFNMSPAIFYNLIVTLKAWRVISEYKASEKGYLFSDENLKLFLKRWKK